MKTTILMCLLLTGSLTLNNVIAAVTVTVKQQDYVFEHEPRLVEVLATIANKQSVYWPTATLYQPGDTQLEKTRQLLISSLYNLYKHYNEEEPDIAQSLEQLITTIADWRLARRLPIIIDYDLARTVAAANPQLPQGKYILHLATRNNTLQLFGAVNKTSKIPHQAHADVSEYINHQIPVDLADKDYVMIIQADGRKIKVPVAYWNKSHQEVMPGSQLFIPFKQSLLHPEFAIINQQIIILALNRVKQ